MSGLPLISLLSGFKTAVDGFTLLADLFASDTGLHALAVLYNVEKIRFLFWGERLKLENEHECLLQRQPVEIQGAIAAVINEIKVAHGIVWREYVAKYGMPSLPAEPDTTQLVATLTAADRVEVKFSQRFWWVTRRKERFKELVTRLETFNNKLNELAPPDELNDVKLVAAILTRLDPRLPLSALPQSDALLAHTVQLKIQNDQASTTAKAVKHIAASELTIFQDSDQMTGRVVGSYSIGPGNLDEQVLVEWKGIDRRSHAAADITSRIEALASLLSIPGDAQPFHRLPFLGLFEDKQFEQRSQSHSRIGLVYGYPASKPKTGIVGPPPSLLDLIKRDQAAHTRPALGKRFELALKLASAVSLFHAADWLHKSFRSDNILFGGSLAEPCITEPYISGFQYGRPSGGSSLETRPVGDTELDMYYHPDVGNGWTKVKELYSLGVVLLEVALWRPVFDTKYKSMSLRQMSDSIVALLKGQFGQDLAGLVGETYLEVIRCCLSGEFGVQTGDTHKEAEELSKMFSLMVVQPLASCTA
jgi:hypothetical protein